MSATSLLIVLSPVIVLVVILGAVMIAALRRANPEDVPEVTRTFVAVFGRLVDILPSGRTIRSSRNSALGDLPSAVDNKDTAIGEEER